MNNLILYKRTLQLKDYLENMEFEDYKPKQIEEANKHMTEIFRLLDRRGK